VKLNQRHSSRSRDKHTTCEVEMSVQTGGGTETYARGRPQDDDEVGYGWVMFAGIMLLIVATLNIIGGIAAISNSHFYVHNTNYVFGSLNTWGWIVLIIGAAELLVGFGIFAKNQFARWTGMFILSLNAVAALLSIPAYPFWSLSIFAIDILAIYGLSAYGGRISRTV
jgi:hypothetical protein